MGITSLRRYYPTHEAPVAPEAESVPVAAPVEPAEAPAAPVQAGESPSREATPPQKKSRRSRKDAAPEANGEEA
jgi:hypothetical protein